MNLASKAEIIIQDGATAFPQYVAGTPIEVGNVERWNQSQGLKSAKVFDVEVKAADAVEITVAELFGISVEVDTFSSKTVTTVTNATDLLSIAGHGLLTGHGPVRIASSTSDLPDGYDADTDYWVIWVSTGTIKLASSLVNAFAETPVAISDDGTGTITLTGTAAYRPRLLSYGLLGNAADGAISCDEYIGWSTRINHRPRTVAYFMVATLDGAVATTVSVHPIVED